MTENELINKIKKLKQIKPEKDWVVLTKNQILGQEQKQTISIFQILFQTKRLKPVFVMATVIILLFVGIAGFLHLAERPVIIVEIPAEPLIAAEQVEIITLALEKLQIEIDQTAVSLKKIEDPQKVLEARNVVVPAIVAAREIIVEVAKIETDEQRRVLTTRVNELEKTLEDVTAIQARYLIQDLKTRTLTELQKEILEKAKQTYQQGNYHKALINSMMVGQMLDR